MNTPHEIYKAFESRISELHPKTRERLLYQLVGVISNSKIIDVPTLHMAILNLEKSTREV